MFRTCQFKVLAGYFNKRFLCVRAGMQPSAGACNSSNTNVIGALKGLVYTFIIGIIGGAGKKKWTQHAYYRLDVVLPCFDTDPPEVD